MRTPIHAAAALVLACGAMVAGCSSAPRGFDSPEPAERIAAATEAARTRDATAVPNLITLLRSDDPAVRMVSIRALEAITGETLGYNHAGPERERERAVRRWVEWYEGRRGSGGSSSKADAKADLRFSTARWGERRYRMESPGDGEPIRA